MATICSIFTLLFIGNLIYAQYIPPTFVSARQHGLLNMDICSPHWDGYIQTPSLIVFTEGHRLNLSASTGYLNFGINHYSIHTGFRTEASDGFTAGIQSFGTSFYNEYSLALSYSKRLTSYLALGIEQKYLGNSIPGIPNSSSIITHLFGSLILKSHNISLSIERNFGLKFFYENEVTRFTIGSQFNLNKQLYIFIKGQYTSPDNWVSGLAIQSQLTKNIALSLSIQLHPLLYGIGLRLPINPHLFIEISNQFHPLLGNHFALGIQWTWSKNKNTSSIQPL